MRKALVYIDDKGNITIDFMGFKGKTCDIGEEKLLKQLEHLKISKKDEKYKTSKELMKEEEVQHA